MSALLSNTYDNTNLFVWNNRYNSLRAQYTNPSGSAATLVKGTIMGRVASSGKLLPQVSSATDGSQVPMGILADDYTVAGSATVDVKICIQGDVNFNKIVFGGSDTLATVITLNDSAGTPNTTKIGTIGDILNRAGILAVQTSENTYADN